MAEFVEPCFEVVGKEWNSEQIVHTPFALIKMGGVASYALLGSVWIISWLGAAGKLLLDSQHQ